VKNSALAITIFKMLPKSLLSRLAGYLARLELPQFILARVIAMYSRKFNVLPEYVMPAGGFKTFDDFFTRRLRAGVHPLTRNKRIAVSPVDARIDRYGDIREATLLQAKGLTYSLADLIPTARSDVFAKGKFMTLYLSPGDYHRIHSPVTGTITGYLNVPGKLFTVQDYMVRSLKGLFVMNERIVTYIQSASGMVAVCKVGAFNVGRISLAYSDIVTNRLRRRREEIFFNGKDRVPVEACDEIGVFHLGSTIILLFEKNSITFNNDLKPGGKIRMGKAIGSLR
jgi:phosphatidylserine decarboxylase